VRSRAPRSPRDWKSDWKSSFAQSPFVSGACHYATDNLRDVDESLWWPLNIQSATAPDSPVIIDIDSSRPARTLQEVAAVAACVAPAIVSRGVRVTREFQQLEGGGRLISPPIKARPIEQLL